MGGARRTSARTGAARPGDVAGRSRPVDANVGVGPADVSAGRHPGEGGPRQHGCGPGSAGALAGPSDHRVRLPKRAPGIEGEKEKHTHSAAAACQEVAPRGAGFEPQAGICHADPSVVDGSVGETGGRSV